MSIRSKRFGLACSVTVLRLREARFIAVSLTSYEANALNQLGREMSTRGGLLGDDFGFSEPSVLRCTSSSSPGVYTVEVDNVVGTIRVGEKQFLIEPKISSNHLVHILGRAKILPRLRADQISVSDVNDLSQLLPAWFAMALSRVLQQGLVRDYRTVRANLDAVRGTLHPIPTADNYYSGRAAFECAYDEFDDDTALNRVLKGAALAVARNPIFGDAVRANARRCLYHFDSVSDWSVIDLRATVDRQTSHYADAVLLARAILRSEYRSIDLGAAQGFCFLVPTAQAVEDGIRMILAEELRGLCSVEKRRFNLGETPVSIHPDLWLRGMNRVADVKYKVYSGWSHSDAYQAVAYASALRCPRAAVLSFGENRPGLPDLPFGEITVSNIVWDASPERLPETSSTDFTASCRRWLENNTSDNRPTTSDVSFA